MLTFKQWLKTAGIVVPLMGIPAVSFSQTNSTSLNSVDYSTILISTDADWRKFLDALREVETGGQPNEGRDAVGDGGKALGPYQIHKSYWQDAVDFDKTIGGKYEDVKDKAYAEKIVKAYLKRYLKNKITYENAARVHNGGPKGHTKAATVKYWKKVKKLLSK